MTTAGQSLTEVEAIRVWRAILPLGQEPPPPMTAQDHRMRRQLLEGEGEVIKTLDPDELVAITRGPDLVYRDSLVGWREQIADTEEAVVIWYGVQTVCCRKRPSELSNVARLEPQAPPDPPAELRLTAGAEGIDVEWRQADDLATLVERSADGAAWSPVTEEPVDGDQWRDSTAAQGQSWSYRLRSVRRLEGGARNYDASSWSADYLDPRRPTPELPIAGEPDDRIDIGFLPGDVNLSGTSEPRDVLALVDGLNGVIALPLERSDINPTELATPADILRLIDLLNGAKSSRPWLGESLPKRP
jgi:hypothetical protein